MRSEIDRLDLRIRLLVALVGAALAIIGWYRWAQGFVW